MAFDQDVESVAETHLEGAFALDVVGELLGALAGEAEAEDMIDGRSQHVLMEAASDSH